MKLIFSRKGADSTNLGIPSPILPSGRMVSLPIPGQRSPHRYRDIQMGDEHLGRFVEDLTSEDDEYTEESIAHHDPDLVRESMEREEGWRPILGQTGAAETHLRNQGVDSGDLFLFFGWFRRVHEEGGEYTYVDSAPNIHALFGWLQIDRRVSTYDRDELPEWALSHTHLSREPRKDNDSVYLAKEKLELPGLEVDLPGGGTFGDFDPRLQLTAEGESRSLWSLPSCFYPDGDKPPLSYNPKDNWTREDGRALLQTNGPGQEYVLDCDQYEGVEEWSADLFNDILR